MKRLVTATLIMACCGMLPAGAQTTPPTTDLYSEQHYERVGRYIYGYQRLLGAIDDKARADLAQAAPALGAHLARVKAEYDAITQGHGDVPDARIDAAWRDVQAAAAELAAWKKAQAQ